MEELKRLIAPAYRRASALGWRAAGLLGVGGTAPEIAYVVENANWSIRWDGTYVTQAVNRRYPGLADLSTRPGRQGGCPPRVVHFGSQYMWETWQAGLSPRNRYVVNFYHGKPEDGPEAARHVDVFLKTVPRLSRIVTSCRLVEDRLRAWGVPVEKVVRIPIGVDTTAFAFAEGAARRAAKRCLGVPEDRLCIGSFQKDGQGWEEGMEPKPIKGPDVFLDAVERIAREHSVFVLLTGPARGFVKTGLERLGVPYRHIFLKDYREIVGCYQALDLYLMTSREEGGPKSVMESMATGTPIVATGCGMAPDLIVDGVNGGLVAVAEGEAVAARALSLLDDPVALPDIVGRARRDVLACDWDVVGAAHLEQVYAPLLAETGREIGR